MQYLGVEYSVKHMPELDPDFIPFGVWLEAYARGAEKPLTIALERDQGKISVRETKIHGTPEMAEADYRCKIPAVVHRRLPHLDLRRQRAGAAPAARLYPHGRARVRRTVHAGRL